MDNMYSCFEYMKIFTVYVWLLYVWPSIVFRKYLNGRGLTFRFMFCNTVQIVLINGMILGLGLFQILDVWIVRSFFWGMPIVSVVVPFIHLIKQKKMFINQQKIICCGWKGLFSHRLKMIITQWKRIFDIYEKRIIEYLMLLIILVFGMIYFSIGQIQEYTYGHYDQYIHFQWILDLKQGNIFSEGIYPEAMHCFIYCMHCLFGVKLYSCMLFLSGIHITAFFVATYCLLKEVFHHRFISLYVLIAWLTYDAGMEGLALEKMYVSMARLLWTLPQEFGMHLIFLCPLALLRFLVMKKNGITTKDWYKDGNLFLLMFGVGAAFSIHFYVVILSFFMCMAVAMAFLWKMISIKNIMILLRTIGYGVNIGAFPMILAYIMGTDLQGSLFWGLAVYNGISTDSVNFSEEKGQVLPLNRNLLREIYEKGIVVIFGEQGAVTLMIILLFIVMFFLYYNRTFEIKIFKKRKKYLPNGKIEQYLALVFGLMLYILLFVGPFIGLPEVVTIERILGILKMLVFAVAGILLDFILLSLNVHKRKNSGKMVVFGCTIIYCFAYLTDFHEYLYSFTTHYKAAVFVTDEVVNRFSKHTYKIISMDDEEGQVEKEKHENLYIFLQNVENDKYYIPVEYIFLYVEKHPVIPGRFHYFKGPSWLAKRVTSDEGLKKSEYPDIDHTEISLEMSQIELSNYSEMTWRYWDSEFRTVANSKAYYWQQDFKEANSLETKVYYEDDDFVCYIIHQDPAEPLNLAINKR